MSFVRTTRLTMTGLAVIVPLGVIAQTARAQREQDPCSFLSASEAEKYVGHLTSPPYRAAGARASKTGEDCVYRGSNGHQLTINPSASGGAAAGKVMTDVPKSLGSALSKGGATGADTMANRVMQQGPAGPWDKVTWIPGGSLFVTKGDAMIVIDMSAASGQQADALALARLAMPRLGHPLAYDGAKAVALAPKPFVHPPKACDLVPRAAVVAAIGTLSGAPANNDDGTGCTYTVKTPEGTRTYAVEYTWEGGRQNYNMLKNGMSTMGGLMGGSGAAMTAKLDSVPTTGQAGQMIGALMKMVGGDASKANGAPSQVGFKTDTTLAGPWDSAALLHGTQLIAVRRDVFVGMSLESADYEKAKALFAAICIRLQ
ncbi:MAG: hypothetical protein ABJF01_16310 [bacterium]